MTDLCDNLLSGRACAQGQSDALDLGDLGSEAQKTFIAGGNSLAVVVDSSVSCILPYFSRAKTLAVTAFMVIGSLGDCGRPARQVQSLHTGADIPFLAAHAAVLKLVLQLTFS